jgi:signal peptidase I
MTATAPEGTSTTTPPGDDPAATGAAGPERHSPWKAVREWAIVLVVALAAAALIRVFVLQQFYISGPSMESTLVQDDRVLVNKLSYRLHDVNRGDVVVFDRITTSGGVIEHDDLIKRVIGLPGEIVEIRDCEVYIDGSRLIEPYLDPADLAQTDLAKRCNVVDMDPQSVPDDMVFVMGDNRPESFDSRMFGSVEVDQIVGRAFVVIWPFSDWAWL